MPTTLTALINALLTVNGMSGALGFVASLIFEQWGWFKNQTPIMKWAVAFLTCVVIGALAAMAKYGTGITPEQLYEPISIAFAASQLAYGRTLIGAANDSQIKSQASRTGG